MKELELLTILTNVRGEYILQAQELRSGQRKQLRMMHRKRIFLIAAVISLLLLLVGCAAVLIGLQKISLGRVTFPQYSQPGWTMDLVSTNGYLDYVNYQATREWIDFITNYDADRVLEQQKDSNGYKEPEDYRIYNCYTPQMQEKVDELCEKYALQLAGPVYFTREPEQVFSAVGISSMMHKSSEDMFSLSGGSYYRSGSFNMVGMVNHCFEGRSTADSILFVYACDRKTVFFPDYVILRDMDSVDSWEYNAWDGTNLILVQSPARGVTVADVGDFFISVTLDFCYSSPEGEVDAHNPCSRKEFEWIADDFMYQIAPREPESDWLQNPNGLNAGVSSQTFADYFDHWLPGSVGSEAYSPDYQQKFVDLDEDGTDEMLIWNARTGVVYEVVTRVDGELQCIYSGDIFLTEDSTRMYLCQGNTLEKALHGKLYGRQWNEYHRMEDHQLMPVEVVMEGNDGKFYWSESGGASSLMWREISESEYNAVRAKYVRIGVPQYPTPERIEGMQGSTGDSIAVIPPQESGDSASNNADSQTTPTSSSFHCEPVTFDGYSLTPEGDSVPVRLTMAVENVLEGEAAWQQMISQGTQLPAPEQGKEYILITVKVTYEDGDLETLNFVENYPASWAAARVHFNIPNDNSNTEDVTYNLLNPIWGSDPFEGRSLTKGESVTGDVAFLQDIGNTQPLYFEGYNKVITFQIH